MLIRLIIGNEFARKDKSKETIIATRDKISWRVRSKIEYLELKAQFLAIQLLVKEIQFF